MIGDVDGFAVGGHRHGERVGTHGDRSARDAGGHINRGDLVGVEADGVGSLGIRGEGDVKRVGTNRDWTARGIRRQINGRDRAQRIIGDVSDVRWYPEREQR